MGALTPDLPLVHAVTSEVLRVYPAAAQLFNLSGQTLAALQHPAAEKQQLVLAVEVLRVFRCEKFCGAYLREPIVHRSAEYAEVIKKVRMIECDPLCLIGAP